MCTEGLLDNINIYLLWMGQMDRINCVYVLDRVTEGRMGNININMLWMGQRDRLDNVYVYVLDRMEAKNMEYYWTEEWRGAVGEEGEQGQLKAEEPGEWK